MIDPIAPTHATQIAASATPVIPSKPAIPPASGADQARLQGNGTGAQHQGVPVKPEGLKGPLAPGTMAGPAPAFAVSLLEAQSRPTPSIPLPAADGAASPAPDTGFQGFAEPPGAPSVDETI